MKVSLTIYLLLISFLSINYVSATSHVLKAQSDESIKTKEQQNHTDNKGLLDMSDHYYLTTLDDKSFAVQVLDKSQWQKRSFGGLPLEHSNAWLQVDFTVTKDFSESYGLLIMMMASYDAYWDGKLLGSNGVVGTNKTSEQPGLIERGFQLMPKHLTKGKHTLSLRISSYHKNTNDLVGSFFIFHGQYPQIMQYASKSTILPLAISGALLVLCFFCFILYLSIIRETSYLLFSGLCLAVFTLFITESWRGLWGYTYDWHIPRLQLVYVLSGLISLLMTAFYAAYFSLSKHARNHVLLANIALQFTVFIAVSGYDAPSLYLMLIGMISALFIAMYAVFSKQQNAWLMLVATFVVILPILVDKRLYMEQYFFISFVLHIAVMLYSLTQSMKLKQQQLIQSQINASRLELELVKRNIQPHFILNTLTAVEEWIEESPPTAIKFIDALAHEFKMMEKISKLTLIPLLDEIRMCEAHLRLMAFRANVNFQLDKKLVNEGQLVPPGVLLTLIENALSHNRYRMKKVVFEIQQSEVNTRCYLSFRAPISNEITKNTLNTGLGTQYIKARMEESYTSHWLYEESISQSDEQKKYWQVQLTCPIKI